MSFEAGPNAGFLLLIAGVLLCYWECLRPGSILPAVAGAIGILSGSYLLWRHHPSDLSILLLAAAILLFALETRSRTFFAAPVLGTACLAVGFGKMFQPPNGINAALALAACVALGTVTAFLASAARRARSAKISDLDPT